MGKESILAQIFKAIIFIPEEEHGLDPPPPPQEPTIHKKYSEMSADVPNHSPMLARSDPADGCMISPCPS